MQKIFNNKPVQSQGLFKPVFFTSHIISILSNQTEVPVTIINTKRYYYIYGFT
mgnify:CR=1 FL=1